jgi:hypothetical protein
LERVRRAIGLAFHLTKRAIGAIMLRGR